MLFLHNLDLRIVLSAVVTVLLGLSAALCITPVTLRRKMLSYDRDGLRTMGFGLVAVTVGLIVPDFTAAYVLVLVGEAVVFLGAWMALKDSTTDGLLNGRAFPFYLLGFAVAVAYGAVGRSTSVELTFYYLTRLTLPVAGTSLLAVLVLLSFASDRYKTDVLSQNRGGRYVLVYGAAAMFMTLIVGANPVMVIALGGLGSVLLALGVLIAIADTVTNILLRPSVTALYVLLIVALLYYSRATF